MTRTATIKHLDPDGLVKNPAFTPVVTVAGPSRTNPPVITVAMVAGLAHPDALVELDAVAVVPPDEPA